MFKLPTIPNPWKYVVSGVLVLFLVLGIVLGVRGCAKDERQENNQIQNTGELIERGKTNSEVLNHVEQAKDAATNPTSNELNIVCEKYDRNC